MPVMTQDIDLDKLFEAIEGAGREHFQGRYPAEIAWYDQHIRYGRRSAMIEATLRAIWQQEMERDAKSLRRSLASGDW